MPGHGFAMGVKHMIFGDDDDKAQRYTADGKNYTFIPGENGSLTAPDNRPAPDPIGPTPRVAKTVMPPAGTPTDVGSSRG